jgi:Cu/Ag efflux pump CusA
MLGRTMFSRLVEASMRMRVLVLAAAAVVAFFGTAYIRQMPIDILPEFAPTIVEIQTEAAGLSANEVEIMVTVGVEELVSGLPWVKSLTSRSVTGLSTVRLEFDAGTPIMRARQMVQERLTTSFLLPNVAKPPIMLQPVSSANRVMMISLSSTSIDPVQLSVLTQWTVKPKLLGVPGVANIAIWGERRRQLQVQVDPEKMRANGVKQNQIISSTGDTLWASNLSYLKASVPGTGGWIDSPNQRLEVRHQLPVSSPEDLAKVGIDGTNLKIGDVAKVVEGHPPMIGDAIVKDGQGLLLVIEKFPGADTLKVTADVEKALATLRPALGGIVIDSEAFRPATFLQWALVNISQAGLIGGALIVVGLAGMLGGWRAPVIGLIAIPLSMLIAAIALHQAGMTGNALLLAGVAAALGGVIDNVVVAAYDVDARLRGHVDGAAGSRSAAARDGMIDMQRPLAFATFIGAIAMMPAFFVGGADGTLIAPAAYGYLAVMLAALAVSLTVAPALFSLLSTQVGAAGRMPSMAKVGGLVAGAALGSLPGSTARSFVATTSGGTAAGTPVGTVADATAKWSLPIPAIATAALLLVAAATIMPGWLHGTDLRATLFPAFKERDLVVQWDAGAGASQVEASRLARLASADLRTVPGVRGVNAHIGRAETGDQIVGVNAGQIWVRLDPKADYAATVAAVQDRIDAYPGISSSIRTHYGERLGDRVTDTQKTVTVRVYGEQRGPLRAKAEEVKAALDSVDGVWDARVETTPEEPQIEVTVNIPAASQVGLKPGDVRRSATTQFSGLTVGRIFELQKVFEVVVWSNPESRTSLSNIQNAMIELPKGGHVRLGDVATVALTPTPSEIRREGISQYVDVIAKVGVRNSETLVRDIEARLKTITFALGYHPKVLGDLAAGQGSSRRVLVVSIIALIGILLTIQASVASWRLAWPVGFALLAAPVGGAIGAASAGLPLSLGVMLGLLCVFLVTVRQGLVLIERYHKLEDQPGATFGPEVAATGARLQFKPVLATNICLALATTPILFLGAGPGLEILHPMAIVILGGLASATITILYILPAIYLQFGSMREPSMKLEIAS